MNMFAFAIDAAERTPLPDGLTLAGIDFLCGRMKRKLMRTPPESEDIFVKEMQAYPIATHTDDANRQHYEVPAEFFALVLGENRKYSCCYYPDAATTLDQAEDIALAETVAHAQISDGMRILELGCGWGSLSLYLAKTFPAATITSVSNSASQRHYILERAAERGLTNLTVITADMNSFAPEGLFDRVVSVEMFEHMSNWHALLSRVKTWLKPEGKLFLHVFTHQNRSYRFDPNDPADWIAQHFFTGGIMPAQDLAHRFGEIFTIEDDWRWSGMHYRRTALHWLENYDRHADAIAPILARVYGRDAALWHRRWRMFFLATAGLFGYGGGNVWGVGHYLMRPAT